MEKMLLKSCHVFLAITLSPAHTKKWEIFFMYSKPIIQYSKVAHITDKPIKF